MLLPRKRKRQVSGNGVTNNSNNRERRKGRPGRPMKHRNDLTAPRYVIRQQQRTLHEQSQKHNDATMPEPNQEPAMSRFERLPRELIQHIFFESMEMNLALTCTTINQALSSESVFRSLILLAYFNPYTYSGERAEVDEKVFLPGNYRFLDNDERRSLQRTIMGFQWCSLARVRSIMPTLSKLAARASYGQEQRDLELFGPAEWEHPDDNLPALPDSNDDETLQHRYSARKTSQIYRIIEEEWDRTWSDQTGAEDTLPFLRIPLTRSVSSRSLSIGCPVLGVLMIPDKVLRGGPWTTENLALLQLLRQGLRAVLLQGGRGKIPSAMFSVSEARLHQGMANAVKEQREDVLLVLVELFVWLRGGSAWDRVSSGRSCAWDRSSATSIHLPPFLFHLAAWSGERSTKLLKLLIRADVDGIPRDDDTLTLWALREAASGSGLGRWLLQRMENVRSDASKEFLFVDGAACLETFPELIKVFYELPFYDEHGYISMESLDRTMRMRRDRIALRERIAQ